MFSHISLEVTGKPGFPPGHFLEQRAGRYATHHAFIAPHAIVCNGLQESPWLQSPPEENPVRTPEEMNAMYWEAQEFRRRKREQKQAQREAASSAPQAAEEQSVTPQHDPCSQPGSLTSPAHPGEKGRS